jgi:antitoxin VapB
VPTAKLFRNGRSQAVRLPKEFRFEGDEVAIRREGQRVVLEPIKSRSWPQRYWRSWTKVSSDFDVPEPLPSGRPTIELDSE